MRTKLAGLTVALTVLAATASSARPLTADTGAGDAPRPVLGPCNNGRPPGFELQSRILFSSTRDHTIDGLGPQLGAEIYSINPDGSDPRRLTDNAFGDGFANLSPDGKRIVFDSDRLTVAPTGLLNVSDLFLMDADGGDQTLLTRGSSASWSPDCREIVFHASASYYATGGAETGIPIKPDPGAATSDSDLFVANVDDLLAGTGEPANITHTPDLIEDDADWSPGPTSAPDGQRIVFTAHPTTDNPVTSNEAEIYVANPDGTDRTQLTGDNPDPRFDDIEERAPAWSPDGARIVFSCRIGGGSAPFQICVINADGSGEQQLTADPARAGQDLTTSWSPDGTRIVFHRMVPGEGFQLFEMNPSLNRDGSLPAARQVTFPPGISLLAHWGVVRAKG